MRKRTISKKLRKLQFDELLLVALGGKEGRDVKLIMKDLKEGKHEHHTIRVDKDFFFDLHKTREGKIEEQIHIPLAVAKLKMSVPEFVQKLVSLISESKTSAENLASQDFTVVIPKNKESVKMIRNEFWKEGKDRMCFTSKNREEFLKYCRVVSSSDLPKQHFPLAFLLKDEEFAGLLLKADGDYFLIDLETIEELIEEQLKIETSL